MAAIVCNQSVLDLQGCVIPGGRCSSQEQVSPGTTNEAWPPSQRGKQPAMRVGGSSPVDSSKQWVPARM
jgi:hypothetical protein